MYDVAIVGSGIGGSHLASLLRGLNVLVIEKDKKALPKDSGIVSTQFKNIFHNKALIKNSITEMELVSPSSKKIKISSRRPFAYILKRELFLEFLRSRAMRRAEMLQGFAKRVDFNGDYYTISVNGTQVSARFVVGCDGANSFVRKSLGISDPKMVYGLMVRSHKVIEGEIQVHFNKYFSPDFFSWIIPQNDEYGLISYTRPREYLEFFRKKLALSGGTVYGFPICLGTTRSYAEAALLIGDACGQNKPITGGGIMFSMKAAAYAAETIQEAFERDRFSPFHLSAYERSWRWDFGAEIQRQLMFRRIYRWLSNSDVDRLFDDFGPSLEQLNSFDYDKFTDSWKKMPKLKMLSFFAASIPSLFRRELN